MLMKERYKSWRNLSAKAPKNSEPNAMMVIRDIPEFSNLENDLVLETKVYRLSGTLHQAKIDKLSKKIFGITAAETEFIVPENYSSLREGSHEKIPSITLSGNTKKVTAQRKSATKRP